MTGLRTSLKLGLRCLTLMGRTGDKPRTVRELSEELEESEKYLEQLLLSLRRARIVQSIRGVHGGFLLARSPDTITLAEIVNTLQGPPQFCDCVGQNCHDCVRPELWRAIEVSMASTLETLTLAHLVENQPLWLVPRPIAVPSENGFQHGAGI